MLKMLPPPFRIIARASATQDRKTPVRLMPTSSSQTSSDISSAGAPLLMPAQLSAIRRGPSSDSPVPTAPSVPAPRPHSPPPFVDPVGPDVETADRGAEFSQPQRDPPADAAAGAGDQG